MGTYIIAWAIAFVFFILCEIATGIALVSIWLAFGALIAMILAIFECSFFAQLTAFVVGSMFLLAVTRPIVKKLQKKTVPTNYELDVGQTAVVTEDIDNSVNKGRVKLNGTYWQARTESGVQISSGETVTVVKVEGAKLIVR